VTNAGIADLLGVGAFSDSATSGIGAIMGA
jgi:hypothetical protein